MKMSSALPKGERNGLEPLIPVFVNEPEALHVAIVIFRTAKITEDVDTGEREPQLRLLRVEPVLPQDASQAERMLRRALESRQGLTTLPIDMEDEITAAFEEAAIDRSTGELHGEDDA